MHPTLPHLPATFLACCLLALSSAFSIPAQAEDSALTAALADSHRTPRFIERDAVRHPAAELEFLGLRPDQTVVEISPGGGYWTEILAPYLRPHGTYYVAVPPAGDPEAPPPGKDKYRAKLSANPELYDRIRLSELGKDHFQVAPAGSAYLIVTFRNLHNWMDAGYAEKALAGFYQALKPGGILGIEDHRGRNDQPQDPKADSGYVRQDYAIELARKAGFELVATSELLANPRDTKDWPKGVWTLPPTLTLGDQDRAKYVAIGEADNFLLKFRKPLR
jgi:predicted methyltransferase